MSDEPPNPQHPLGYRPAAEDGVHEKSPTDGILRGVLSFVGAVACWLLAIVAYTPGRRQPPLDVIQEGWGLLAIPIALAVVVLGIRATADDAPPLGSRLGNWALILVCSLCLGAIAIYFVRQWTSGSH
jgi:hypothetical protein